jgi:hypothetical protein
MPSPGEAPLHLRTHPPAARLAFRQKSGGLTPAEHRKAARLIEIEGEFGEELVVAQAD